METKIIIDDYEDLQWYSYVSFLATAGHNWRKLCYAVAGNWDWTVVAAKQ